jgi:hypothetical protein
MNAPRDAVPFTLLPYLAWLALLLCLAALGWLYSVASSVVMRCMSRLSGRFGK